MQKTPRAKEKVGANPPDVTPCFEQAENYTETDYLTQTKRAASLVRQSRKQAVCGNVVNNRRSLALSDSMDKVTPQPRSRKRRMLLIGGIAFAVVLVWLAIDLYGSRTAHLRDFDADEVARLETAMWRSYYSRQQVRLFLELGELLRKQYNMPAARSNLVAYHAAKAAFVFKAGKQRSDYEKALPDLVKFYQAVRDVSDTPFDVNRAAKLELEWWIIHRQRSQHVEGDLARSLAELQAELYHVPVEKLIEHGHLRAEAMTIRDNKAEAGGVTEEDWAKIAGLLRGSWRSLSNAIKT